MDNQGKKVLAATVDKYSEASYFLFQAIHTYHSAEQFRYNLNAFIQAQRNITFILQSESDKPKEFDEWYKKQQEKMKGNELLKKFLKTRNLIVKQDMLKLKSRAYIGLFRDRKLKLCFIKDADVFTDTEELLTGAQKILVGKLIDEGHSAIGEQLGVAKVWRVEAIGKGEVLFWCFKSLAYMEQLLSEAHELFGGKFEPGIEIEAFGDEPVMEDPKDFDKLNPFQIMLESDLDPSLIEKWGW